MPNHINAILIIDHCNKIINPLHTDNDNNANDIYKTNSANNIGNVGNSLPIETQQKKQFMADISPKPDSISNIIRSYKSAVTKHANRLGLQNVWQSRFHDYIVRNEIEYKRISDYIINNPTLWTEDKFYS